MELQEPEVVVELFALLQLLVVDLEVDKRQVLLVVEQKVVVIHRRLFLHKVIREEINLDVALVVELEVELVEQVETYLEVVVVQEDQED
tara:strand:+ start:79 stop:345 length:267 start_codon:yes stop_codon:yes gene_type:complete